MTFLLLKNYDHCTIVNDDADFRVGRVYPLNGRYGPYRVHASVGPLDRKTREAGIVKSLMTRSQPSLPAMTNIHCDGTGSTIRITNLRCSRT
jgi:hypothetical protein